MGSICVCVYIDIYVYIYIYIYWVRIEISKWGLNQWTVACSWVFDRSHNLCSSLQTALSTLSHQVCWVPDLTRVPTVRPYHGYRNHLGVSINGGTPKWLVYRENPIKMDDLGVPPFMKTPIWFKQAASVVPGRKSASTLLEDPRHTRLNGPWALLSIWPRKIGKIGWNQNLFVLL